MTINEAITYSRKLAEENEQIVEWLKELKMLRKKAEGDKWYQLGRADAYERSIDILVASTGKWQKYLRK